MNGKRVKEKWNGERDYWLVGIWTERKRVQRQRVELEYSLDFTFTPFHLFPLLLNIVFCARDGSRKGHGKQSVFTI